MIKGLKLTEKKLSVEEMNTEDLEQLVSLVRAFRGEAQPNHYTSGGLITPPQTYEVAPREQIIPLKSFEPKDVPSDESILEMVKNALNTHLGEIEPVTWEVAKNRSNPIPPESVSDFIADGIKKKGTNVTNNDESLSSEVESPNFNPEPKEELKKSSGGLAVPISERFKGKANFPTTPGQVEKFLGKQIISPRLAKAKQKYDEAPVPVTPATPAPKKEEEPEFWKTGIKETNGVKRYKLHYKCPTCNKNGRKYVISDPEKGTYPTTTNCESCFSKLRVRPALDKKVFSLDNRDGFGNYLVAVEEIHDTKRKTRAFKH